MKRRGIKKSKDDRPRRKVTYRLYPKPAQIAELERQHLLHQQLYNALLEQRIQAYRKQGKTLNYFEQAKELTILRRECPEFRALNAQSMQVTANRVDEAFQGFFRRLSNGKGKAGFPRFQSIKRFTGWGYQNLGDGWRPFPGEGMKHGWLRLMGVGRVKVRGKARFSGTPKTCEIIKKQDRWYASVTFACNPKRKRGRAKIGFDWGVNTFLTIAHSGGKMDSVENPKLLAKASKRLKRAQKALSRKKRGSNNRNKAKKEVAKHHAKVANQRHAFLHKKSAKLVANSKVIITEKLAVNNMTRSAKGTIENPGKNVRQKAGLNRNILDTAPSAFLKMLRYKAAEALRHEVAH